MSLYSGFFVSLLNQVFPPRCGACGEWGNAGLCQRCWRAFEPQHRHLPSAHGGLSVFACGVYSEGLRHVILRFKEQGSQPVAEHLAGRLAVRLMAFRPEWIRAHPTVVPIPASPGRSRHRGHRPVDMLARGLATALDLPLAVDALALVGDPAPRKQLNERNRLAASDLQFRVAPQWRPRSGSVLLVDDVVTTGQTLSLAADALRASGCARVVAVTLATVARNALRVA